MKKGEILLEISGGGLKDLEVNFKGGVKDLAVTFCQIALQNKQFETALFAATDTLKNIENREE